MEKSVSSLKILNIIICVIFLIAFVIVGTRVTVKANEINSNDNEVLPSNPFELGYDYPKLNEKYIKVQEEIENNINRQGHKYHVSYDLWEMCEGVHLYSLASIYSAFDSISFIFFY